MTDATRAARRDRLEILTSKRSRWLADELVMQALQLGHYQSRAQSRKTTDATARGDMALEGVPEIHTTYKRIGLTVWESSEEGYYCFRFAVGDETIEGKVQTRLAGMAVKRAQRVIARKLKRLRETSP